ncbi:MAG: DNA adenine methylase [Armatimonadota bacterium]
MQVHLSDDKRSNVHLINENYDYLYEQLITYIGNKRALLDFIGNGIAVVKNRLNKDKISTFDVFSGSGVVARYLKQHSSLVIANDIEKYSYIINSCYLSNKESLDINRLKEIYEDIKFRLDIMTLSEGIIYKHYAPKDENKISKDDRVFYTPRNAKYIDTARQIIDELPAEIQCYFLAPLLSSASVHANTAGVFKGFYKNKETGIGQYGGKNQDALTRILGDINLKFPVFSNFNCDYKVYQQDSNKLANEIEEVDLAYLDPPYNQHPYGSNYFMLNVIAEYKEPKNISKVSGIPDNWNRSKYNKSRHAYNELRDLVSKLKAKYILVSFNSEGFISLEDMISMLKSFGKVDTLETKYNTFRGSRNLSSRNIHVKEYLYLLEKT